MAKRIMCLACPTEKHEPLKRDRAAWEAATENERPWRTVIGVLLLAECKACGSTISRRPWRGERVAVRAA